MHAILEVWIWNWLWDVSQINTGILNTLGHGCLSPETSIILVLGGSFL